MKKRFVHLITQNIELQEKIEEISKTNLINFTLLKIEQTPDFARILLTFETEKDFHSFFDIHFIDYKNDYRMETDILDIKRIEAIVNA